MNAVIEVDHLTKRFKDTVAVDDISFRLEENTIYGFLGRNGAGKTTTMSIVTAQSFASSGKVRVFGEAPYENHRVLSRMCFVREGQKYPEEFTATHALRAASLAFPRWDQEYAEQLIKDFRLPMKTKIPKLSRGQLSAVGVIIGLASRAEITFFDEPYLGLDAVARSLFYERLLEDYAEHPRTIVLSSHLIDEISDLIEKVIVIDEGTILVDESTDALRDRAFTLTGDAAEVARIVGDREVLHEESLGRVSAVTALGSLSPEEFAEVRRVGLEPAPVPLQQLVIRLTRQRERNSK